MKRAITNKIKRISNYFLVIIGVIGIQALTILEYKDCNGYYKGESCKLLKKLNISYPGNFMIDNYLAIKELFINKTTSGTAVNSINEVSNRFDKLSAGFTFNYPKGTRSNAGYILLSTADTEKDGIPLIELWDLNKQELIHKWDLDIGYILKEAGIYDKKENSVRFLHPLLLNDGNIVFNLAGRLIKLAPSGEILKINNELSFHHSQEIDSKGRLYVPVWKTNESGIEIPNRHLNGGFAILDSELNILKTFYLGDIYEKAGLEFQLFNPKPSTDPYHLNDVEPFRNNLDKDIVLLSIRFQSTIMAYDFRNEKILWMLQGYTNHQHDVDVLNENGSMISVFDNNVYRGLSTEINKVTKISNLPPLINNQNMPLLIYNNASNHSDEQKLNIEVEDFKGIRENTLKPKTPTNGRSDYYLDNNSLFVEETIYGRSFEYDTNENKLIWQHINRNDKTGIYYMGSWSRRIETLPSSTINTLLKYSKN